MATAFRAAGMVVHESFGRIHGFEKVPAGVRMIFEKDGVVDSAEATLAIAAIGWLADTAGLNLTAAGVATTDRGYVQVDEQLRTTAPHIFAAGDITGRLMLVPQAVQAGYLAATNAVLNRGARSAAQASPIGSFTDPEYAQVGPTEAQSPPRPRRRGGHCAVRRRRRGRSSTGAPTGSASSSSTAARTRYSAATWSASGRWRLIQVAAVAIAGAMQVEHFARIPLSFPTYTNVLGRAALDAARQLGVSDFLGSRPSRPRAAPDRRPDVVRRGSVARPSASQGGVTSSPTSSIWA